MSPRAAWRLESLGFADVYDYEAGKADWLAAGLASEGPAAAVPRAGSVSRRGVPTCDLRELVGDVEARVREAEWDVCIVVNETEVVLGLVQLSELEGDPERRIEEAMRPGPSTFRPNVDIGEMAAYMAKHDLPSAPVTTSDGRLVGMLYRDDAERAAHEVHEGTRPAGGRSPEEDSHGER